MVSPIRNDSFTGWFHVTNRGARRYNVFIDDVDRRLFVRLMQSAAESASVDVAGYCLMGNHYHLLVHCRTGGLSSTLQRLGARYTRAFNTSHGFDGSLFKQRFHSTQVESDKQLLATARYIHRNPLELSYQLDVYPWSNFACRRPASKRTESERFVHEIAGGIDQYAKLVSTDLPADMTSFSDGVRQWAPEPRGDIGELDLVASAAAYSIGVAPEIVYENRSTKSNPARLVAVLLAIESGVCGPRLIASHFGFAESSSVRVMAHRGRKKFEGDLSFRILLNSARIRLASLRDGSVPVTA